MAGATSSGRGRELFAIDSLVRSRQLPGIDLHLRYAERTPAGLTLHLAFYNNGSGNLAFVSGADPGTARLVGATPETPVARSPSFESTIAPEATWLAGAATNGSLTFAAGLARAFTLEFPGFPALPFRLDTPLRAVPDPPPVEAGTFLYGFEVESAHFPGLVLVVERLAVAASKLDLEVSLQNRGDRPVALQSTLSGRDAVLFDARWNQYRSSVADHSLAPGGAPARGSLPPGGGVSGVVRFPRPASGTSMLLQYPGFPLIRLPLEQNDEAALATAADLPPSSEPRPTVVAAQSDLNDQARANADADRLVRSLGTAIAARQRNSYLDAFVPAVQIAQTALFDRILALPLVEISYTPAGRGTIAGDELRGVRVTCTYRVRDVDPSNIFTASLDFSFRREGSRWRIAAIGGALPFWATGPTEAERLGAFWIFFRPVSRPDVPSIGQETAMALQRVEQVLPGRASLVNVMFVTETSHEFGTLTGRDPAHFLGVALSRYSFEAGGIQIGSAAFYINGAAFRADPRHNRQQTITHELTHLALAKETMPFTPLWVVEGMAMEVSRDLPVATMRAVVQSGGLQSWSLQALTARRSFAESDPAGQQTGIDYAYSAYLARYLSATYGFDKYVAFYDSFANIPFDDLRADLSAAQTTSLSDQTMGALAAKLSPTQLQEAFGVASDTLERDFKKWLPEHIDGA